MFSRLFRHLRNRWWHPMEGEAKWDFTYKWVWPMITSLAATIWGVIEDTPGPMLIQTVLTIFAIGLFIQQNWLQKSRREKPPFTDTDQESLENVPTAEQTVQFISSLMKDKDRASKLPIKIVSTTEGQRLARLLMDTFPLGDYEILVNNENTDYIFPATTTHDKIIIRYQEASSLKDPDRSDRALAYLIIIRALDRFIKIDAHQLFPSSSNINYFQIEVRGGL